MAASDERTDAGARDMTSSPERMALDQLFDGDALYALRSAVAAHASDIGLAEHVTSDLVLVAHELASNAVRHGGATPSTPGRLRLWAADGVVVCQVHDPGPGPEDLATQGLSPVDPAARSGRGLWIVRRLVSRLDIVTGPDGTTVTAVVVRPSTVD